MLILGGTVTGAFLIATAREERQGCGPNSCYAEVDNDEAKSLVGMLLLGAGVGFGIPLALTKSKPRIEISPMAAPAGYRVRDQNGDVIARDALSVRLLTGLALLGRF
jgi:hypothetical protein